jgi:hypothetical protein
VTQTNTPCAASTWLHSTVQRLAGVRTAEHTGKCTRLSGHVLHTANTPPQHGDRHLHGGWLHDGSTKYAARYQLPLLPAGMHSPTSMAALGQYSTWQVCAQQHTQGMCRVWLGMCCMLPTPPPQHGDRHPHGGWRHDGNTKHAAQYQVPLPTARVHPPPSREPGACRVDGCQMVNNCRCSGSSHCVPHCTCYYAQQRTPPPSMVTCTCRWMAA